MFISERRRRRRRPLVVAVALLALAGAALAAYLILTNRTDDVRRGDEVEFRAPPPPRPKVDDTVDWPVYHFDLAHRGYLPARVAPPFKERWVFSGRVLMEFPPIVVDGSVYFMRNNGGTYRLDADTGKVKWKNQIGSLSATSPAYSDGRLFVSSLSGKITALRAKSGKVLWQKQLGSRTESSPIVRRGVVYFGTEGGDLYAVFAKTGRVKWKFSASGAIKASPALSGSTLYVGDYSGRMYAVWAKTGRARWSTGTSGSKFGFAAGNFYSTPAVAFGRVYAGNTDSKVYSFGAKTGTLAWSHSTGGYVYSSPAVANVPGTHRLDSLDRARWRPHLRRPFDRGPHRLLRRPRLESHLRCRCAHRQACLQAQPWLLQPDRLGRQAPLHDRLRKRYGARPREGHPQAPIAAWRNLPGRGRVTSGEPPRRP
jgi:hypothetical protein